ncbi:hypothetical protein [Salinibacter grassmerensis]|uniref:hypothetical protein n=1 Tax=Salinibacter grassmerensis TaxID=3040353 RepID=UPI0021E850B3|nr:hypothetical protein [Salinibacter grassmerensis]
MEELLASRTSPDDEPPSDGERRPAHIKFKLSKDAMEAKEALAVHWDVPEQEGAAVATQLTVSFLKDEDEDTRHRFVEKARNQPRPLTRTTHVVSRDTKSLLETTAGNLDLTRNQCFDACLRLAYTIVQFLREDQLERHEAHVSALRHLLDRAKVIEADLQEEATDIDPLKPAITAVRRQIEAIVEDVEDELSRGQPLGRTHEFT